MALVDANPKSRDWKKEVAHTAGKVMQGREMFRDALSLEVVFYVPRPKSHFGVRGLRDSAPSYPSKRPDVTKLLRGLEDALTGIVWRDDAQVVRQVAEKVYGEPARVEVRVGVLP